MKEDLSSSREPIENAEPQSTPQSNQAPALARRIGIFDATMIVMGGIIGSGIFMNPSVVAQKVHTPLLILSAWVVGGLVALAGAFIYAELAELRPRVGGQYAYIREAYHPALAFMYGWMLLLVIQTGGMAAVAVTFANYFAGLAGIPRSSWTSPIIAALALALLTVINCFGVRAGSSLQSALMVLKIAAILILVGVGLWAGRQAEAVVSEQLATDNWQLITAFGAAMVPVLFAYGGWQTANFIAGEVREPRKSLPRALLIGVMGVIALYTAVNFVCVSVLGPAGLAATETPASSVMQRALGKKGETIIAIGISISTLGFLSQSILTAPRVYFAMADDKLFFKSVARLAPRTRVPVVAIALQGALAIIIALSGSYAQILSYVVAFDSIFFGLTATTIFYFRRRAGNDRARFKVPGHPVTTIFFVAVEWLVVVNTFYTSPVNSAIGAAIMLAGIPVYLYWRSRNEQ
ncbi:MAG TPA: amino acid permease [Blastocatellia bacterium]|nr:amino acid permease [Blastocatellia bacterium]